MSAMQPGFSGKSNCFDFLSIPVCEARNAVELMVVTMYDTFLIADIVEIKHIMLPPSSRDFKDIYVVFELMETDLHQVGSISRCI